MKELVYALLIIPMLLLISYAVFTPFFLNSRSTYETTVTNELLGNLSTNGTSFTSDYYMKPDSLIGLDGGNSTVDAECLDMSTVDYKQGVSLGNITVYCNATGSTIAVYADYTAYSGTGYDAALKAEAGTRSGYSLGGQLPFLYIAVAVVSVILGAFGINRVFGS